MLLTLHVAASRPRLRHRSPVGLDDDRVEFDWLTAVRARQFGTERKLGDLRPDAAAGGAWRRWRRRPLAGARYKRAGRFQGRVADSGFLRPAPPRGLLGGSGAASAGGFALGGGRLLGGRRQSASTTLNTCLPSPGPCTCAARVHSGGHDRAWEAALLLVSCSWALDTRPSNCLHFTYRGQFLSTQRAEIRCAVILTCHCHACGYQIGAALIC